MSAGKIFQLLQESDNQGVFKINIHSNVVFRQEGMVQVTHVLGLNNQGIVVLKKNSFGAQVGVLSA